MDLIDKLDPPPSGDQLQVRFARVMVVAAAALAAEIFAKKVFNKSIAPKLTKESLVIPKN